MADRPIDALPAASQVTPDSLFVLQQSNASKKLTAQILENWLTSFADGHGGIQSIVPQSTSGLVDTYRITLADTTAIDFTVTNGRGITGVQKIGTTDLVDTYQISYNDGPPTTFTVTNGAKGDKGDDAHTWFRYASQMPTEDSHDFGEAPDDWIGINSGNSPTAPTDWKAYTWSKFKGDKGEPGDPALLLSNSVEYQASTSGTIIPSGTWNRAIPPVPQGKYLWTRTTTQFNTGDPVVSYSVARMGIDGLGSVSSVNGASPDADGNVILTADSVGALPVTGGTMTGGINMNGQPLTGLNAPTEDSDAASKGYVDNFANSRMVRNLLDNSDFTNPVNQRGLSNYDGGIYTIDRWKGANVNLTVNNGSISVSKGSREYGLLVQFIDRLVEGNTYTFAAENTAGEVAVLVFQYAVGMPHAAASFTEATHTIVARYSTNSKLGFVGFSNDGSVDMKIKWAALYEGAYTAKTLPPYVPRGYAQELTECQRFFYRAGAGMYGSGYVRNANTARFMMPIPQQMRVSPTVTGYIGGSFNICAMNGVHYSDASTLSVAEHTGVKENFLLLDWYKDGSSLPMNSPVSAFFEHNLDFSADL